MSMDPLLDLLRASLEEQVPVKICVRGSMVKGTVRRISDYAVEIENRESRSVARLQNIDIVTIEPHRSAFKDP